KVQILADFIAAASHDFRTPLSVINTSAYLLNRIGDDEQRKRHLEQIQEQTNHIERLIDGLLTMSRLDRGDVFRFKPVNLNAIIQQIEMRKRSHVDEKPLSFMLELAANLPLISADNGWLHTAITHLIDNAIHFTAAGGSVSVRTCLEHESAVVVVSDTGSGISPDDLPHIFKRLYRGEGHRPVGGQGLGLSMVSRIVEAHQGSVEVESQPGVGSTFRIILPLRRVDTSAAPLPSP
ncbi:MAG: HAMP domain-containing sensor histidine kinase, partial [Chloroflexota bacterium]